MSSPWKEFATKRITQWSGPVVSLVGGLAIVGWILDLDAAKSILPGLATMKFNTALCFVLAGAGLSALHTDNPGTLRRLTGIICAVVVLVIGALSFLQYISVWNAGIDEAFARDTTSAPEAAPGRMSHATALNFVVSAFALIFLHFKRFALLQVSGILSGLVGLFALTGYLYGVSDLYEMPGFGTMALHTAICFIILSTGLLCARPSFGIMASFTGPRPGSQVAWRLWLPLIIITIGFGAVVERAETLRWITTQMDSAILVVFVILMATLVIWFNASSLNRSHDRLVQSLREVTDLKSALDEHSIVAVTDPQGKIIFVNEKFCAISQYSREELIGKDHRIINSGFHPKEFFQDLWTTICQGRIWKGEVKNRAKDGSFYWVDTTIVPFLNEQGKPNQYVAIRTDVTEHKTTENALREINDTLESKVAERTKELEMVNKELESFSYSVSHDLRAPLRSIAGFAQILKENYSSSLDDTAQDYFGRILAATERMGALIDDMLNLSRVTRETFRPEPVNLGKLARSVVERLRLSSPDREVDFIIADDLEVQGGTQQLHIMLENLLGNAWKFTSQTSRPRIEFSARDEGAERVFSIADNGAGFDMRYAGKLFAPFQRLHSMKEFPGTGIGLATVQRIVHRHGGRVWAEAEVNRGATFHFTIETT